MPVAHPNSRLSRRTAIAAALAAAVPAVAHADAGADAELHWLSRELDIEIERAAVVIADLADVPDGALAGIDAVLEAIAAAPPPQTLAGLAVVARAVHYLDGAFLESREYDCTTGELLQLRLTTAAMRLGGAKPVPPGA